MTQGLEDLGDHIAAALPGKVDSAGLARGELVIVVQAQAIREVLLFLRDDAQCLFKQLMDIAGVDYPGRALRFDVVYHLLSLDHNQRARVRVAVDEATPVPSVTRVFSTAAWFEREVWDMFGIAFAGNTDLRRILTDYGFEGHPLRKDFPLSGFVELRYDEERKQVVYDAVRLTQDFRSFDFQSPWEGPLTGGAKTSGEGAGS